MTITPATRSRIPVTIIQGVQTLLGAEPGKAWAPGEARASTLVFIGRNLPREVFEQGLALCVEGGAQDPATVLRGRS